MSGLPDRDEVREVLGVGLKTLLEKPDLAQAVFDHIEADWGTLNPVVMIASLGTSQQPLTGQGSRSGFLYSLHVYVLYAMEDGSWTPAQAQTALDKINGAIVKWMNEKTNKNTATWKSLKQTADSVVLPESVGGAGYWHEMIPIKAEVY